MASIRFEPVGFGARLSFALDGDPSPDMDGYPSKFGIGWDIRPVAGEHVSIATGGNLKDMRGSVSIRVGDATPDGKAKYKAGNPVRWGGLHFHEAIDEFPASYSVDLYVSQRVLDRVQRLAELGRPPTLELDFGDDPIDRPEAEGKYKGIEYDVVGKKWDNTGHRHLEILWCNFTAELGTLSVNDGALDAADRMRQLQPTKADIAVLRDSVAVLQNQIREFATRLLWLASAVVILLVVLAFRH